MRLKRSSTNTKAPHVLAIASGGGHWTQLLRLRPAFDGCQVTYVSTIGGHADQVVGSRFLTVPDANRWERMRSLRSAASVAWVLVRVRPDVVVSTGALPGFFAIAMGKVALRRRTVWIDSLANADQLSMSGQHARRFADVWLTQWEHLAATDGPDYAGSVLG